MRANFRSPNTTIRRFFKEITFFVLLITFLVTLFHFFLLKSNPKDYSVLSDKVAELHELTAYTREFAFCSGVNVSHFSNDSVYFRLFSDLMTDENNYIYQISQENHTFSSPKELLDYYYNVELNQYNAEAELQLQAGYLPHNPHFSSLFTDPLNPVRRGYGLESSIFVALLSSFDGNCAKTVESIFTTAFYPVNIFVGVLDGYPDSSAYCTPFSFLNSSNQESMKFTFNDNLRIRRVQNVRLSTSTNKSQRFFVEPDDPMRFATLELYRGESFVLFIRSGTQLLPGWDWRLKLMYSYEAKDKNIVLTSSLKFPLEELKEAFREAAISSAFVSETGSTDVSKNADFGVSLDLMVKSFQECFFCGLLLVLPKECWSPDFIQKMKSEVSAVTGTSLEIIETLLSGNTSFLSLSWKIDYSSSTFEDIEKYLFVEGGTKNFSRKVDSQPFRNNFFFSFTDCNGGFNEREKIIYKKAFEVCFLERNREDFKSLFFEIVNNAKTVDIPIISSLNSSTGTTSLTVPRLSTVLEEMRYISPLNYSSLSLSTSPQKIVSLDFLFSRAEAFFDYPQENQLAFIDHQKEKVLKPISFDPFLAVLKPSEADLLASAKLWTSGWDFKALTEPLGFTFGETQSKGDFLDTSNVYFRKARKETLKRLNRIFSDNSTKRTDKLRKGFELGTQRSLKDFLDFVQLTNINFQ